jgi:hypothetical protein
MLGKGRKKISTPTGLRPLPTWLNPNAIAGLSVHMTFLRRSFSEIIGQSPRPRLRNKLASGE